MVDFSSEDVFPAGKLLFQVGCLSIAPLFVAGVGSKTGSRTDSLEVLMESAGRVGKKGTGAFSVKRHCAHFITHAHYILIICTRICILFLIPSFLSSFVCTSWGGVNHQVDMRSVGNLEGVTVADVAHVCLVRSCLYVPESKSRVSSKTGCQARTCVFLCVCDLVFTGLDCCCRLSWSVATTRARQGPYTTRS